MLALMMMVFILGLAAAAYSDYRRRRIPNYVTLPLLALGLAVNAIFANGLGLLNAFWGICVGGGVFMILYVFKMMGAGDVKLAAAVGAWMGMPQMLPALFYIIMAGGVLAVGQIVMMKLRPNNRMPAQESILPSGDQRINGGADNLLKPTLPYGIAIAAGTLVSLLIIF